MNSENPTPTGKDYLSESNSKEIELLMQSIKSIIDDVQTIRMTHELNKLTEVRLVDLQYTANMVIETVKETLNS